MNKGLIVEVNCNICGSGNKHFVSRKGQFAIPISVVICKNCGLTYLSPRWSKEQYETFYHHDYDELYRSNVKPISITYSDVGLLTRVESNINGSDSVENVLDIGSGDGSSLVAIKKIFGNANLFAIEPSERSQVSLRKNGIKLVSSSVDTNWHNEYENYFDLIIMRHVLEHFLDPKEVLCKVNVALKDAGLVYLAVPNSLKPSKHKPLETKWFRAVHTYYFNKYSLWNLLIQSNLWPYKIVEGDEYHSGEIFLFAKKNDFQHKLNISTEHFKIQKTVFEERLKRERINPVKSLINKVKLILRSINN